MSIRSNRILSDSLLGLICMTCTYHAFGSIKTVSVKADGVSSAEHEVSNNRSQGYRLPIISGITNRITFKGTNVHNCDRVEIVDANNSTIISTIKGSSLTKKGNGISVLGSGEGSLSFDLRSSVLPPVSQNFIIRIRYLIEVSGYDRLDCKVTIRGRITSIEWIGPNLPQVDRSNVLPITTLTSGTTYTLRFNGSGFGGAGQQYYDGLQETLFCSNEFEFINTNLTCNSDGSQITLVFTPVAISNFGGISCDLVQVFTPCKGMPIAFNIIGNIEGGWGSYVITDTQLLYQASETTRS